jgi:hypothetical protein
MRCFAPVCVLDCHGNLGDTGEYEFTEKDWSNEKVNAWKCIVEISREHCGHPLLFFAPLVKET